MEKREFSPWEWQNERSYVQAVEVTNASGTLYCSGQAAVHADGTSSTEGMEAQLLEALANLEAVVTGAGYELKNIVRLNVFTTNSAALWQHFSLLQQWIEKHGIKQATTLMEVKSLFETLSVELEATVVK